ncbi:App1 family protein [Robertkochia aurantiaca]|uniref:App1 family protein n=1 Tax=Robertkochia aurantiaca TaxID=2873700 RepID=UPI001CCEA5D4|nr:phosphatase domain-containing protein [Robertkochia sp. 3YJGBD-33]
MASKNLFRKILGRKKPVIVLPYQGFASDQQIYAKARVLEDEGIKHHQNDSLLKNLYNSYKRFESDEIKNALVRVHILDMEFTYRSDKEGYIYVDEKVENESLQKVSSEWIPARFQLLHKNEEVFTTETKLLKPLPVSNFGIISDMDDTVLQTGISSRFKHQVLINTLLRHSSKRKPLEGMNRFYKKLRKGPEQNSSNPFFYLSNSPWNLYDYLIDFLDFHDFPEGILLLRDFGLHLVRKKHFTVRNKYRTISRLLTTYPDMEFVLIGDAADQDHDIYLEIARNFEDRIKAVFIRNIKGSKKSVYVKELIENTAHVKAFLFNDADEALIKAREFGLIV